MASAIDSLKMTNSPAKTLDFSDSDKENVFKPIVGIPDDFDANVEDVKPTVASTIKPEEAHEPLLQENPGRFVLFPIKYHDVSFSTLRVWWRVSQVSTMTHANWFFFTGLANVQEGRGFFLDRRRD